MKTDVIIVTGSDETTEAALAQADKIAAYKDLSPKSALHLRLLVEEVMGMMRSITGETRGEFWIEEKDTEFQIHLRVDTAMSFEKREKLLSASTTGKNEAAKGLMGRLRNLFEQGEPETGAFLYHPRMLETTGALDWEWSMVAYQSELSQRIEKDESSRQMWDELEKSVVTHVADDVKVSIKGRCAEMIIFKKMT